MHALRNIFAVRTADPRRRTGLASEMARFLPLPPRSLASGWLVGLEDLRLSDPAPAGSAEAGLFIAEGQDLVEGWLRDQGSRGDYRRVHELCAGAAKRIASVPGDFGFVLLSDDGVTVVRSVTGLVPWYVFHSPDLIIVSTRLAWFHRVFPELPADVLTLATLSDGMTFIDQRTPIGGVHLVAAGHVERASTVRSPRSEAYWTPPEAPRRRPAETVHQEHAAELRRLLISGLERDLDPAGANLLAVSGGVDSSALGALIAGPAGRTVDSTVSILPELGNPSRPSLAPYVDTMLELLRPAKHWPLDLDATAWVELLAAAPRLAYPVAHPLLAFLPKIKAERDINVYVGGEMADSLLVGPYNAHTDWLTALSPAGLLRGLLGRDRLPMRRRYAPRAWAANRLRLRAGRPVLPYEDALPTYFLPELRDEYDEWCDRQRRIMAQLPGPYRSHEMLRRLDGWISQNWEVCSELGIRRSIPFCQRALYDLVFSSHPLEHAMPPKRLLRTALRGIVPAANLDRVDKGGWGSGTVRRTMPFPDRLTTIIRPGWCEPPAEQSFGDAATLTILEVATEPIAMPR